MPKSNSRCCQRQIFGFCQGTVPWSWQRTVPHRLRETTSPTLFGIRKHAPTNFEGCEHPECLHGWRAVLHGFSERVISTPNISGGWELWLHRCSSDESRALEKLVSLIHPEYLDCWALAFLIIHPDPCEEQVSWTFQGTHYSLQISRRTVSPKFTALKLFHSGVYVWLRDVRTAQSHSDWWASHCRVLDL